MIWYDPFLPLPASVVRSVFRRDLGHEVSFVLTVFPRRKPLSQRRASCQHVQHQKTEEEVPVGGYRLSRFSSAAHPESVLKQIFTTCCQDDHF
ncbi:hypothetical protein Q8A67_007366 [Cirrhinus molitorella]|uniref:Uncharacterized protein n=1 Tax=Cirrhinus molitorella TaxID=172907 RepID=A0AA88PUW1_9TELE|nr:hypothetical protein Q8A67_007366 [Cirrhinus molitorella]